MTLKEEMSLICILCLGLVFLGGCETAKGAAGGAAGGIGMTAAGTAHGAATDTKNIWQAILKADDWIKNNLW
jgi:hypothetical protein